MTTMSKVMCLREKVSEVESPSLANTEDLEGWGPPGTSKLETSSRDSCVLPSLFVPHQALLAPICFPLPKQAES